MTSTEQDKSKSTEIPAGTSKVWHFHPRLPIDMSPVFDIPPKPKAALLWLISTWVKLTPPVNHLLFTLVVYAFFLPSIALMSSFSWEWMMQIFAINFVAICIVAGGLHNYLYIFKVQGTHLKFDARPMEKNSRFIFGNQVHDNMFWTLAVSVPLWSAWMILYFYALANQTIPSLDSFDTSPLWFVLMFFVIRFWQSFHFYWIHRLIHHPWLFKNVHYRHHRNINVGPWSGLSMHPVEGFLYFSGILIHFVLPSHPIHVIFHMFSLSLGAAFSHAGFDRLRIKNQLIAKVGSFHHQLHHRFFDCNYGSEEMPLDRWFGSFHDGTDDATKHIHERRKSIHSREK